MQIPKVALIVAHSGYQHIEYNVPKDLFKKAGFDVTTVSDKSGSATAKDGSTTKVDLILQDLKIDEYAGVFFIGGPGALEHLDNELSYSIIQEAKRTLTLVGAICISTRILAHAGILDGKYATGWNGDNKLPQIYKDYHVVYLPEKKVVECEKIITATGPEAAQEFAKQIISLLKANF